VYKIAVLASTNGTNFQSLIDARDAGEMKGVEISCLVTNKPDCGAVEKAKKVGIPVHVVLTDGKSRVEFDREVVKILDQYGVQLVVLGGYMRIISGEMVRRYKNHIINVHPSLLPLHAGGMDMNVHQEVLDSGEKETGMSIHIVDLGVDTGKVLLQKRVKVEKGDTAEILKKKVQTLEKEWYPKVVEMFAGGEL
jgi:phosphoribosylglycinamide formyltransferase 1